MSTIQLTVTDTDQTTKNISVAANPKSSLMEVLNELDFDVPGACGGIASCATCHIKVLNGNVPNAIDTDEQWMLDDMPNTDDKSRLACQIPLVEQLSGLEIQVIGE